MNTELILKAISKPVSVLHAIFLVKTWISRNLAVVVLSLVFLFVFEAKYSTNHNVYFEIRFILENLKKIQKEESFI